MADNWYAVIDSNGALVSTGTSVADDATLAASGLTALTLDGDPTGQVWDAATHKFTQPPPRHNSYPKIDFIKRFAPAEFMALKASTDPMVQWFMYLVENASLITPLDADVQQGLGYVTTIGLLTAERAAIIGAN